METMENNFGKIREKMNAIRQEMRHEIETIKDNVKRVSKPSGQLLMT